MFRRAIILSALALMMPGVANAADETGWAAAISYSDARRGYTVLVLRDGAVVCEARSGSPEDAYELWSGTKSFVGIMAAAAVQDKLITLDEPVANTITEWAGVPLKKDVTLRHLLSMTSGQKSTIGKPPTYAEAVGQDLSAPPGTAFQYGPAPMQLFGEVLRRKLVAAGRSGDLQAYLAERILNPLGISVAQWRRGPDGNPLLPQGMILTAREWAKFGEFIRLGGTRDGKPLVDSAAFGDLFKGTSANPGYGLTWWLPHAGHGADPITASTDIGRRADELPRDLVVAAGAGDQRLYVIPSRQLVIVRQARLDLAALGPGADPATKWSDADFLKLLLD